MSAPQQNFNIQKWVAAVSVLLLVVKFTAYAYTFSVAILSDALESIVNVVASLIGLYSLYVAARPRDQIVASEGDSVVHEDQALSAQEQDANLSPLAGKGIWYGRVQPKHVEGIVEQTIGHGKVIRELFRGGINRNGSMIRI